MPNGGVAGLGARTARRGMHGGLTGRTHSSIPLAAVVGSRGMSTSRPGSGSVVTARAGSAPAAAVPVSSYNGTVVQNQRLAPTAAQAAYNKNLAVDQDWATQYAKQSRNERQSAKSDLVKMRAARAAI